MAGASEPHVWKKGDLCLKWVGIICRVIEVKPADPSKPPSSRQRQQRLKIKAVFAPIGDYSKTAVVLAWQCKPLSLVDLGTSYMKLGNFIREEARRLGMEE